MRIEKEIKDYLVFSGDSILDAMKRINNNNSHIVFVVQENGVLIGAVSDGNIRRWMTQTTELDLSLPVDMVMNRDFVARPVSDSLDQVAQYFDHKRQIIPLTDELGRFVALARKSAIGLQIANFLITDENPTFIIAEVGNNHNGDIGLAKELVDHAVEAKVDCVKFQMRDLSSLYSNQGKTGEAGYDLGSQYTLELLNKFQLNNDALCQVFDYCERRGILPLCTPWDMLSLRVLDDYGLEGFKVASADFTNYEMLEALSKTGKPLICSTGMSTEAEIHGSVRKLRSLGASYALLHCNSTYPTPYKDVNLRYVPRLKKLSNSVVGYSGHERGFEVPVAAVALGARIVEKHLTVNRNLEGNDHKVSLLPNELAGMVRQIRNVEEAMGQSGERELTQGELINRETLAKSVVINRNLPQGQVIQRNMLEVKSPGQGLQPNRIDEVVGKLALKNLKAGACLFETDVIANSTKKRMHYCFTRPYGIPVRYHDYHSLIEDMKIDFAEFHLSYHDLDVKLSDYFSGQQPIGFAVHCPELFGGDHILDLATENADYRAHSIAELKRTVEVAKSLRQYFPCTSAPVLVLNAGGWSTQGFLPVEARAAMYDRVANALGEVDLSSVQLAVQTMPPFPWHFGGQSFHNLFMDPEEIAAFCERTGYHICLDISHSIMACNYYKWDFTKFLKGVLPHTIHLHIADARGVDGEGVPVGKGDVNFANLRDLVNRYAPDIQFVPEVWQGHKNEGEGFWSALEFLEKYGI